MKWIETKRIDYAGIHQRELKCPCCGYKITTDLMVTPRKCYVCEEEGEGVATE